MYVCNELTLFFTSMGNRKIEMDVDSMMGCSFKSQVERMFCGCVKNESGEFCSRVTEIWDEVVEVFGSRSVEELKDEVSDVMFGFGRLAGYMCGRVYVKMWFDERHVRKIEKRMEEYGCVRSRRHLVNGTCPCLGE